MTANPAFQRAMHSLAHPISLGAIALLLFNDHWLRWNHPSWLTGKLGDFTWLVFAPFIAGLLLAWVIPARWKRQETYVGGLSIALIGMWFALAKTVPLVHEWTAVAWNNLIGWQGSLRLDSTDLLTLPALLLSAWVWWRVGGERTPRMASLHSDPKWKPLAYMAFGLGIVATLASDGPYFTYSNSGIVIICQAGDRLITATERMPTTVFNNEPGANIENADDYTITTNWNMFSSEDGGLSWAEQSTSNFQFPAEGCSDQSITQLTDPNNPAIRYRWQSGGPIERSADAGASWTIDYALAEYQQDVRRYYNHYSTGRGLSDYTRYFIRGPVSGLIDTVTGNLVLAMSWDGVLVRRPAGEWRWVDVGAAYRLADVSGADKIDDALFFEFWLAGALGFLILTSAEVYIHSRSVQRAQLIWLGLGWVMWLILTMLLPSSKGSVNAPGWFPLALSSLVSLIFIALPLTIPALWDLIRNFRHYILRIMGMGLLAAGLFLLPFILWARGTIPPYTTAWVFALLLAGCAVAAAYWQLKRVLPVALSPPPKKPTEEIVHSE